MDLIKQTRGKTLTTKIVKVSGYKNTLLHFLNLLNSVIHNFFKLSNPSLTN